MTITYSLAPMPKWYIADLVGRPLGGGSMYTYSNLDKTTFKFIFQDPAGNFPWTDPVLFDENGSQGPFYWEVDSDDPTDTYYIEVYDSDGVLQWTISDFTPPGGGGGSIITTALDLENLIVNNVFWRGTVGTTPVSTTTQFHLAPGAHAAFSNNVTNSSGTYTGPDIYFLKNNTNATDTLSLPTFTLGSTPLTGDVTPVNYLNYTCTNTPAAETTKVVQFPITTQVQNLSNQNVTVTIWARCNSGNTSLTLQWYQFFGDGVGASAPAVTNIQTLTLTAAWQKFIIQDNIPDVTGQVLGSMGACANDALFLQVGYPLGSATNIDFTKPCVYLGNISPQEDYHTYDMIDGVINAQRTGYVIPGYAASSPGSPPGYVVMNDGTIGSAASEATTRANSDTFALYNLLYNNVTVPSSNTLCIVTAFSGNAVNDYVANRVMHLPAVLGRAMCSAGSGAGLTPRALASITGSETISIAAMPAHNHPGSVMPFQSFNASGGGTSVVETPGSVSGNYALSIASQGSGAADGNMQPSSFMNFFIKL